jgi:peptidoglycan/xylan/chitin deacetylase (PgdA/CDA1 family)
VQHSVRLASPIGRHVLVTVALLALVASGAGVAGALPVSIALVAAVLLLLTVAVGVVSPSSGVFARPVTGVRTERRELSLTFDDGPDARWTPALLDMLEARGHRATFFVIGVRAERHTALLGEMRRRGHEVANHSWAHSFATPFFPPARLAAELGRANDLIERATGVRPRWFRPPVGLLSPRIPPAALAAGLRLVTWTASARDGVASTTIVRALARLDASIVPGAILVMHDAALRGDREPVARELLRVVLDRMESAGLHSVTLSELCAGAVARPVDPDAERNGRADDRAEQDAKRKAADRPRQ